MIRIPFKTSVILFLLIQLYPVFAQDTNAAGVISFLFMGDVNLGRTVGQRILKGETDYPFKKFANILTRADEIFINLECPVTDQNGETQSPESNIIFCAPPQATATIKQAGITVVSTANNHAFDYGLKGLYETIELLSKDSIKFVGTIRNAGDNFFPVIIDREGIRIGVVAYTQTVNMVRGIRSGLISIFDSSRVKDQIDSLRSKVDFVLVSYHGGDEYKDLPGKSAEHQMDLIAEFGADMVIGHHSHVPQGIRLHHGCLIFNSLGNAVFRQPQKYWTQRSFAALIDFTRRNDIRKISSIELIPFRPGYQIQANLESEEIKELMDRIQKLSTVSIILTERGYFVEL